VYVYYRHKNLEDWANAFFFGSFQQEAQKVQEFIGQYAVKGLVLDDMEYPALRVGTVNYYG